MKKLVSLLLALALLLTAAVCVAEGSEAAAIGSPDNPVVVRYLCKDVDPSDPDVQTYVQQISEKMAALGQYVTIEVMEAPAGTYADAVPLAMSTGELEADLVYFQGGDQTCANLGLLEDLTDYIANSTYVQDIMEDYNKERLANYPYLLWLSPATQYIPIMRADHLEAIGMAETLKDDPSVENYHTALKKLVDEGYVKYGFSGDGSMTRADHMFNHAFGVTSTIMKDADDNYVYYIATEAEKNLIEFYATCYAEGLIDPDYLTSTWSDVQQKFYAGDLAMFCATQGDVVDSYCKKIVINQGEAAEGVVLPPAGGESYISVSVAKETRGYAINAESPQEVKDAAFAILDFMASPDGRVLDKLGIEGVHYNVVDGEVVLTDRFEEWWSKIWETYANLDENFVDKTILMVPQGWESLEMAKKYYTPDVDVSLPDDMLPYYDAVFALYNEISTAIITGQRPISDYDTFIQDYYANGGTQLAEYLATVLD